MKERTESKIIADAKSFVKFRLCSNYQTNFNTSTIMDDDSYEASTGEVEPK